MDMKSKTLKRHLDKILTSYKDSYKIKVFVDEKSTKTGKSYSIRVSKFTVRYRSEEDRDSDLKNLLVLIREVFPEKETSL